MVWRAAHADMHVVAPLRIVVRCDVVAQGRVVNCSCHDHDDVARRRARWGVGMCARASAPSAVQRSLLFLTHLPLSLSSLLSLSPCLHLLLCKLYLLLLLHLHLVEKFTAYQKVVEACLSNAATGWDV